MQEDDKGGVILIRKIILAVTFAGIFVLTFAIGVGFIIAGKLVNPWYYLGLALWPLLIMLGIVNLKYIRVLARHYNLVGSKIVVD